MAGWMANPKCHPSAQAGQNITVEQTMDLNSERCYQGDKLVLLSWGCLLNNQAWLWVLAPSRNFSRNQDATNTVVFVTWERDRASLAWGLLISPLVPWLCIHFLLRQMRLQLLTGLCHMVSWGWKPESQRISPSVLGGHSGSRWSFQHPQP